ncbi:HesA/MoeB/ThiF family protein [Geobacter benzoatilyticus]|uniref:Molybdopterin-synthase adenylyltransferase MoeB n=1 Tax=Geobacter benzoatilyticus TaxID=2815309 RepID=A0ABX7Q412_9BACT|nr:molybdopterin-synthase adenylyltransferase MoeB [Geobacter benzoatilyticus]QSV46114.1 molybdopterin-synthase adenylyltransferase MoeB [Geobacter benzoatilyticus]
MMTKEQTERYARHIMLEKVGHAGQERLLAGKVMIIGAGGLGSPIALYLAAAGVGTIGLADSDRVELSNLQRQIAHHTADLGRPKVVSAREKITAMNPDVNVTTFETRVDSSNIKGIIENFDFVIDATDNFDTKFLINDACVSIGKPFSHGGILQFNGQTMTVLPGKSPCYRCIFPDPPENEEVATACSRAGVMGILPGIIGSLQATEAIKHLLDIGDLLTGRLLTYNALSLKFREIPIKQNSNCACSND